MHSLSQTLKNRVPIRIRRVSEARLSIRRHGSGRDTGLTRKGRHFPLSLEIWGNSRASVEVRGQSTRYTRVERACQRTASIHAHHLVRSSETMSLAMRCEAEVWPYSIFSLTPRVGTKVSAPLKLRRPTIVLPVVLSTHSKSTVMM